MQICCQKKNKEGRQTTVDQGLQRNVTHKNALSFGKKTEATQQIRARNTPCTPQSLCNWPQIT